ncbi:MAG: ATP-binding protein [Bacteroidales bacterium]|nr:ATP-binding protein [Bacteroidales bacterium]
MNIVRRLIHIYFALIIVQCLSIHRVEAQQSESETSKVLSWGDVFEQAGNDQKAIELYKDAISQAKTSKEVWMATEKLAQLYQRKRQNRETLKLYDSLFGNQKVLQDTATLMYLFDGIGRVYFAMGDYVNAIKSYNKSSELMEAAHLMYFKSPLGIHKAWTLIKGGDAVEAERLLLSAEKEGVAKNDKVLLQDVYEAQAELYKMNGDYKRAFLALDNHVSSYHDVNSGIIKNLKNTSSKVSTTKDAEEAIRYENAYNDMKRLYEDELLKNKKSRDRAYLVGVGTLLLVGVTIWLSMLYYRSRQRIKALTAKTIERQNLLAKVSENFATPFNQLICFAELQMQYAMNAQNRELMNYARSMYNSAQQMYLMLGNVLAWSQMHSNKPIVKTVVNVAFHVERVVEICRMTAESKNIHLAIELDDTVNVLANEVHFDTIMRNIISNALVFTHQGGRVNVSVTNERTNIAIKVEDTGVGMDASRINEINERRMVEPAIGTKKECGMGLGLYISNTLAEMNGGEILMLSKKGQGSIVTLLLPKGD